MSDKGEEIFVKEVEEVVKKPKRKLTEKQLENLRIGREKMKLKREKAKLEKQQAETNNTGFTKKEIKTNDKASKENQTENRKALKKKRKTLKEINKEKELALKSKLQKHEEATIKKKQSRQELYSNLRLKCLEKAKTISEYQQIEEALDGITEEILYDDDKLKSYAVDVMNPYINEGDRVDEI